MLRDPDILDGISIGRNIGAMAPDATKLPTIMVTASYRGDFERCKLLCESMDARVTGHTRHLILVEAADVPLFSQLAGPRREIIDERALLPVWLRPFPDPLSGGRRRIWLSPFGPPLRGWHVQQLRRFAIAAEIDEAIMVSIDSDVVFLREFDVSAFSRDGRISFYRKADALADVAPDMIDDHLAWSRKAGELLGITAPETTDTGYITTLVPWRTSAVRRMVERIKTVTGQSWMKALSRTRQLSECTIYGRFVDEVEGRQDDYAVMTESLCHVYWSGQALGEKALANFVDDLGPHQVAAGIQSFTATDPALIRRAAGLL
ncbi:DUF6492 family protein [Jiella marina]|uniref:DUF6492 family protein n=1 Tax=Jiella sp. LLJ827 TaxID=2917712 RepID=UPI002100A761|nr:DUF6492 family protein [Jiella sp. LLJ827]MCQ0990301.1 DUF6492 family protein [Jiella sp. LLJ827]